jgi:mannose-6-phosphate isomerase-like protein (cupin superfamily)
MLKSLALSFALGFPLLSAEGYAPATFVTTAEVAAALKEQPPNTQTFDKVIKTTDEGDYKVSIVILRRIPKPGVEDTALSHERVTEVYQILTGAGTFESGGTMTKTSSTDWTAQAAGPSTRGTIVGGQTQPMAPGDTVVILPKVPHRFSHLDGTITYLVTRIEAKSK